jgi:predicted metal-dependent hydrolase
LASTIGLVPEPPPPYRVRRSARARRARITVTPEGEAVVVLPQRASEQAAAQLVQRHADWVRRHIARTTLETSVLQSRPPLGAGRILSVNGIEHEVIVVERPGRGRVVQALVPGGDGIRGELIVRGTRAAAPRLLEAWLRDEARSVLVARIAALAPGLGVAPRRLSVRGQRSRWGSASRDGSMSFNWRLVLAPPFVLDSVVVHELAHLRIPGHTRSFWALVKRHAPRTDEARRWLREHHRELLAALD